MRSVTVQRNPLRERDIHILNFKDEDGTTLHGARDIAHWILVCEKKDKACPSSHPAPAPGNWVHGNRHPNRTPRYIGVSSTQQTVHTLPAVPASRSGSRPAGIPLSVRALCLLHLQCTVGPAAAPPTQSVALLFGAQAYYYGVPRNVTTARPWRTQR